MSRPIEEVFARSLAQLTRLLRFDAAVLFSNVPDLNMLWPMKRYGNLPERVPPAFPGAHLIGEALGASAAAVADELTIERDGESWLRAKGAKTALTVPLRHGDERLGVLVVWSHLTLEVDAQALRVISVLSAELAAALRRAPMFVTTDMQRHQIEAVSRIIDGASNLGSSGEGSLYAMVARETRQLTGADSIAFARPRRTRVFTDVLTRGSDRPREAMQRTVLRSRLPPYDLTFSISWIERFDPTEQQRRLLDLISSALSAIEGLRARVAAAERERRSQYLADVGKALSISLDLSVLFEQIQKLFVPVSADWVIVDVCGPESSEAAEYPHNSATASTPERLRTAVHSITTTQGPTIARPIVQRVNPQDDELAQMVIMPLMAREKNVGVIGFGRSAARDHADALDVALYRELSSHASRAIANATTFRKEQHIADILQHALLPAILPSDGRTLLDAAYAPAAAESQIGGDWYDVFELDEDCFAVSIGDVGGHGVRAAATMNVVRLAFRAAALSEDDPQRVIERADAVLRLEDDAPMVTAIYGIVDLRRSRFTYACAGHIPPLLIRDGEITSLSHGGVPLGVGLANESSRSFEIDLNRGDTLLLYTDGLIEYARDAIAGEQRLRQLLEALIPMASKSTLARDIHAATFKNGAKQSDDVAVLAISLLQPVRQARSEGPDVPSMTAISPELR